MPSIPLTAPDPDEIPEKVQTLLQEIKFELAVRQKKNIPEIQSGFSTQLRSMKKGFPTSFF